MEVSINHFLQSMQNPIFTAISQVLATLADNGLIYIIIALIMILIKKYRSKGTFLFLNLASCAAIGMVLKKIIGRQRPCFAHPNQVVCFNPENEFTSMPSGHMIMTTAFVLVMIKYFPKYTWLWITLLIVMGISRMYLGAHYISDLLVAMLIAFAVFIILNIIWKKIISKKMSK